MSAYWYWDWDWRPGQMAAAKAAAGKPTAKDRSHARPRDVKPCQKVAVLRPRPYPPTDDPPDSVTSWNSWTQDQKDHDGTYLPDPDQFWVACNTVGNCCPNNCQFYDFWVVLPNGHSIKDFKCRCAP